MANSRKRCENFHLPPIPKTNISAPMTVPIRINPQLHLRLKLKATEKGWKIGELVEFLIEPRIDSVKPKPKKQK